MREPREKETGTVAKRQSICQRSKRVETRVARYLWGPEAARDWKEQHDIRGEDADGNTWTGEVKSYAWPAGPKRLWAILMAAFEQATGYERDRRFSVLVPTGASVEDALVMYPDCGVPVIVTLRQFRATVLQVEPAEASEAA